MRLSATLFTTRLNERKKIRRKTAEAGALRTGYRVPVLTVSGLGCKSSEFDHPAQASYLIGLGLPHNGKHLRYRLVAFFLVEQEAIVAGQCNPKLLLSNRQCFPCQLDFVHRLEACNVGSVILPRGFHDFG